MTSTPNTPTNLAPSQKTSTKLRRTSALEGGYCHGVDQMAAPLVLMHAYPSAYAHRLIMFAYVATCLCIFVSAYGFLCLLIIMHAYVCLFGCLWFMMSVKENSVGTMQYGGKGRGIRNFSMEVG
jgi:Ca2+/Na+ antiporter